MKKGILFLLAIALVGASLFILIDSGVRADRWQVVLPLVFLFGAGYIVGNTNFRTDD